MNVSSPAVYFEYKIFLELTFISNVLKVFYDNLKEGFLIFLKNWNWIFKEKFSLKNSELIEIEAQIKII